MKIPEIYPEALYQTSLLEKHERMLVITKDNPRLYYNQLIEFNSKLRYPLFCYISKGTNPILSLEFNNGAKLDFIQNVENLEALLLGRRANAFLIEPHTAELPKSLQGGFYKYHIKNKEDELLDNLAEYFNYQPSDTIYD